MKHLSFSSVPLAALAAIIGSTGLANAQSCPFSITIDGEASIGGELICTEIGVGTNIWDLTVEFTETPVSPPQTIALILSNSLPSAAIRNLIINISDGAPRDLRSDLIVELSTNPLTSFPAGVQLIDKGADADDTRLHIGLFAVEGDVGSVYCNKITFDLSVAGDVTGTIAATPIAGFPWHTGLSNAVIESGIASIEIQGSLLGMIRCEYGIIGNISATTIGTPGAPADISVVGGAAFIDQQLARQGSGLELQELIGRVQVLGDANMTLISNALFGGFTSPSARRIEIGGDLSGILFLRSLADWARIPLRAA